MGYQLVTGYVAPFTHPRPTGHVYEGITVHHWGSPADGPTFEGTVSWLTRPDAGASVHYVAESGRVAMIADPTTKRTWHAGDGADGPGNNTQISIEVNPRWSDGDYATVAELIRDIRATFGDLPLNPHNKWTATECPGVADLQRLDRLARATPGGNMFKRHPVDNPRITYPFGAGGEAWGSNKHLGVDYGGYEGQPIYAPADGTVVWARGSAAAAGNIWEQIPGSGNNGNCIIINHGPSDWATHTLYAHLSAIVVKEGQWVTAGQLIGHMGNTGYSFGTHLHWEMFIDYMEGQYPAGTFYGRVNPLEYFDVVTNVPIAPGSAGGSSTNDTTQAPKPKEWYEMPIPKTDLDKISKAVWQMGGSRPGHTIWSDVAGTAGQVKQLTASVAGLTKVLSAGSGLTEGQITEAVKAAFIDLVKEEKP